MSELWTAITGWFTKYLRIIELIADTLIVIGFFYLGYHTRVVLDEAATSKETAKVIAAVPKVITVTNSIEKVIHDKPDPCSIAVIPDDIAQQLHKQ